MASIKQQIISGILAAIMLVFIYGIILIFH